MSDSPTLMAIRVNREINRQASDSLPGLLVSARKAGHSIAEVMDASGLSRPRVFQLLKIGKEENPV